GGLPPLEISPNRPVATPIPSSGISATRSELEVKGNCFAIYFLWLSVRLTESSPGPVTVARYKMIDHRFIQNFFI
ncbi:MAG TPA: hypothetical protein VMZ02_05615, partial [Candidatus Limnocylindrales bacterium]|nr:hypothetical protein [Candidatus Limnocylindrales bacterium]